jgi:radical SAM superfamily enzyme YgiQ (UPF0313 family)
MTVTHPHRHPKAENARVLLTSVFGPYAQDDVYGSRRINPMELYQNQVTRAQGPFSLRMFHRSFGLILIQENIEAPCTLLDFPTLERFTEELKTQTYDIIGISSIVCNTEKVGVMCRLIRQHQSKAKIVIGGHIANISELPQMIDCDFIVKGDGVRWFRQYLGLDPDRPLKHPAFYSGFGTRILGVDLPEKPRHMAAMLIPSVGCPMGCNFCSTSHLFGGKGHSIQFYKTGDELFDVMCELERKLKTQSFFVLDENFLFYREKALRLLELMEQHHKSWSFYLFSSANIIKNYTIDQLVRFGVRWIWMGLEGRNSAYEKLHGADTRSLVKELQSNGITVLGSSILGLDEHTETSLEEAVRWAVEHATDFHQFMLYTALPGTPLYRDRIEKGVLFSRDQMALADIHGQYRFNFKHPHLSSHDESRLLIEAFERDFKANGPSLGRFIHTALQSWRLHKDHVSSRVRKRLEREVSELSHSFGAALWAIKKWYRNDKNLLGRVKGSLEILHEEFGWKTRLTAPILGNFAYYFARMEERRLAKGWSYEPPTFYEQNERAKISLRSRLEAERRMPRAACL